MTKKALLIVDPQKDFCPGGALAVASGNDIMPLLHDMLSNADGRDWRVLVSRDWHPRQTSHFAEFGGPWPVHCVENTPGAEFHPNLEIGGEDTIISKAMQPDEDGYSPLCDNAFVPDGRSAVQFIRDENIDTLYVGGLATDYCVKAGVLDALKLGLKVYLLTDAIGAVNIMPGDGHRAIAEMLDAGVILTTTDDVINEED